MFTRYIVKRWGWGKMSRWGIWDRLAEDWMAVNLSRHEAQEQVAALNR